jgi:large subunit ribosomal protein L24
MPRHIRAGDTVIVNSGSHKGKTGEVLQIDTGKDRVIVKGVNLQTKHMKPTQASPKGGVIKREASIHISNVNVVIDGKPTRVRFETREDGSKVRVAARNGQPIPGLARKRKGERAKTETL